LKINPLFGQAYVELALWHVRQGDLAPALAVARHAEQLEPSRAGYHILSARILQRLGRNKQAAEFSQFVAERWHGPDHNEAVELWKQLPAADKPAGIELSESVPSSTNSAEGKVVSTACGQDNEGITITIESGGKKQTFHSKGPFTAGFSDTLWYGADHFQLCRHLKGLRAVVRYKPTNDKEFAGEFVELEFRDDLPSLPEGKSTKNTDGRQ
jgi:tetratricopeptide (TPR) repeat protein